MFYGGFDFHFSHFLSRLVTLNKFLKFFVIVDQEEPDFQVGDSLFQIVVNRSPKSLTCEIVVDLFSHLLQSLRLLFHYIQVVNIISIKLFNF